MAKTLLRGEELEKRAEELGVSLHELYGTRSEGRGGVTILERRKVAEVCVVRTGRLA